MYDGVITPEWNAKYAVFTVDSVTVVSQVNPHSKAIATQRTAMSYLVNGNMSTEAIPAGTYFQLVNSLITGRSDGEYTASKAIPANTAIDSTYFNESAPITGGGLNSLNSKLKPEGFLAYKDYAASNLKITVANGYAKVGNVYTDFGMPSGGNVIGFFIRGWSSSPALSLAASSTGDDIYVLSRDAGTVASIIVRLWYINPNA